MCRLKYPTIEFFLSIRWDDINILVVPFDGPDHFRTIVQSRFRCDSRFAPDSKDVERAARIALRLLLPLPRNIQGVSPDVVVRTHWISIDEERKTETLRDLRSRTRIVLCTDAFSLGVNISDIDFVFQWDVTEKLTMESL